MRLTPLDIQQKRFGSSLKGYKHEEVEAFLDLVSSEFEAVIKENIGHKEELSRTQERLRELEGRERAIQETMVTAQRITDDIREQARKEAELVIGEAELQAEKLVHNAHQRLVRIVEDIGELKRQRTQFEAQVEQAVRSHLKLLETMRVEGPRIDDENVTFLPTKPAASAD